MKRSLIGLIALVVFALSSVGSAAAAKPANHACLGKDISAYAEAGSDFGSFVKELAASNGAAEEILAHLAGEVPDSAIPNSCND